MPRGRRIDLRIGVNLGDVIIEGDDIYGDGVNIAARLESLAEPGGVSVSGTVFDHVIGKVDMTFADRGEHRVKNIPGPLRVYSVHLGHLIPAERLAQIAALRAIVADGLSMLDERRANRIDRIFTNTRQLLLKFLDPGLVDELQAELEANR